MFHNIGNFSSFLSQTILTHIALHPLFVLATRHPSVVAIGTWNSLLSKNSGPATPTGIGIYPITFSQQAPITLQKKYKTITKVTLQ